MQETYNKMFFNPLAPNDVYILRTAQLHFKYLLNTYTY